MADVRVRSAEYDQRFRDAAFAWLRERGQAPVVGRPELMAFKFEGDRIGLIDQTRGIRRPAVLRGALSIMTTYSPSEASAPYDDAPGPDGYLRYKYRGTDPEQGDNRAIRDAMGERLPMIWFYGVGPGTYLATFPVFAIAEERAQHQFVVSADVPVDLAEPWSGSMAGSAAGSAIEREYRLIHAYQRVHQPVFRARVMRAYGQSCAMCSLRHVSLLDAAHIPGREARPGRHRGALRGVPGGGSVSAGPFKGNSHGSHMQVSPTRRTVESTNH